MSLWKEQPPTIEDIKEARERIKGLAHITPVLTCSTIDEIAERKIFFKCEQFQKVITFLLFIYYYFILYLYLLFLFIIIFMY